MNKEENIKAVNDYILKLEKIEKNTQLDDDSLLDVLGGIGSSIIALRLVLKLSPKYIKEINSLNKTATGDTIQERAIAMKQVLTRIVEDYSKS